MMPKKSFSSCRDGFDPGPDLECAGTCSESFDPGPDLPYFDSVGDLGHCCSSVDGDPGPDIELFNDASEVSDVSEVSEQPVKTRLISFTVNAVDVGQGQDRPSKLSKYAQNGLNLNRIRNALHDSAGCCQSHCLSKFCIPKVSAVCEKYWQLSDNKQRFLLRYLWNIDAQDVGEAHSDKTCATRSTWSFGGQQVCLHAFCKLLGTSKRTVCARVHGNVDLRCTNRLRDTPKSRDIDRFWLEYWSSNAETLALPEKARPTKEDGDDVLIYDEGVLVQMEEYDFSAVEDWSIGTSEVELFSRLGNTQALLKLPRRFLPHGRLADYYMEYRSWKTASMPSSFTPLVEEGSDDDIGGDADMRGDAKAAMFNTFAQRWSLVWRHIMKIRKSSQHKECNICFNYRHQLRSHGPLDEKMVLAAKWRDHLHWQYVDRCVYWSLRWASRAKLDVLTIVIDGLDKSKFVLPKYEFGRKSADLAKCHRPRVNITGAIAHGWCRGVIISDQQLGTGASFFCEVLCQTIEKVTKMSQASQVSLPSHLVVLVDNTVAQAKNNEGTQFMAHLTSKYHFRSTNMLMLTEGHTHEDIGMDATHHRLALYDREPSCQTHPQIGPN